MRHVLNKISNLNLGSNKPVANEAATFPIKASYLVTALLVFSVPVLIGIAINDVLTVAAISLPFAAGIAVQSISKGLVSE